MPRTRPNEWYADLLRETLPSTFEEAEKGRVEFVSTGVWLAGLSSALLGLFFVNLEKFWFVSERGAKWIAALLSISVLMGVLQRVLVLIAWGNESRARSELMSWLTGYRKALTVPEELSEEWGAEEIVARLQRDYEFDCGFMLKQSGDPMPLLRAIYLALYAQWDRLDRDHLRLVIEQLGKYCGWDEHEVAQHMKAFDGSQEESQAKGIHHFQWLGLAALALCLGGLAFVCAVVVACVGFLLS